MPDFLVTFIFALGASAWVYNKAQHYNGGLTQRSLTAAGVCFVVAFIVFFTIINAVSSKFG